VCTLLPVVLLQVRYAARLKGKNIFYVNSILGLLQGLLRALRPPKQSKAANTATTATAASAAAAAEPEVLRLNDFAFRAGIDNVNLFKVERYMRRSGICQKIMGFLDLTNTAADTTTTASAATAAAGATGTAVGAGATRTATAVGATAGASKADNGIGTGTSSGRFVSRHVSALQTAHQFLLALTNADADGRVIINRGSSSSNSSSKQPGTK
jgi:chromosome transmission fidelity protein 1